MEIPLVYMFPNSITRFLAGSWNSNPGDSKMNIATATTTGPQSATILISDRPIHVWLDIDLCDTKTEKRDLQRAKETLPCRPGEELRRFSIVTWRAIVSLLFAIS